LLGLPPELPEVVKQSSRELMLELTGIDPTKCPQCTRGTMVVIWTFPNLSVPELNHLPHTWDSS
jgi:hypothetical protein